MKGDSVFQKNIQQGSMNITRNGTASTPNQNMEDMSNKSDKSCETSPAVSRYGRTHKPKISDDFLPTDKKVGAILGISPKRPTNQTFDSHSSLTSLEKTVEKGRLVSELLGCDNRKKKRGRKPKAQLTSSVKSSNVSQEENTSELVEPSDSVIQSEASTSDKAENPIQIEVEVEVKDDEQPTVLNIKKEKENEIMSPDVTSSVDDNSLPRNVWDQSALGSVQVCGWSPGDLAWARVGGHPFWPCMIAIDPLTKVFTKIKRVGRGLTTVQRSLHVQFFGDNGRHSWVSTSCVIRFEGKGGLQDFADKVLTEIKKKDKKFSSAFVIRPSSKLQWDLAVREAEDALPKTNQERIKFFEDQFPPEKYINECSFKKIEEETKKTSRSLKRKRVDTEKDEKPVKQVKIEPQETSMEVKKEKVTKNNDPDVSRKKRGKRKRVKKELSDYRLFTEKYSKHASEIHPGITEDKLEKLMLRMWSAMDEQEKSMYKVDAGNCCVESSSEEEDSNDNDNSSLSTRESSPLLLSQSLKKLTGIFRGTRQEKVCQICLKPGNTVKCKGLCSGVFHIECSKSYPSVKEEIVETETKKKRGRAPKIPKNDDSLVNGKSSKDSLDEDSAGATSNSETDKEELASDKEHVKQTKTSGEDNDSGEFRCKDCSQNRLSCCFLCNKEKDPKTNSDDRFRCSNGHCGKYYHLECVKAWPQASCVDGSSKKQASSNKIVITSESSRSQVLTCPQHVCHTCASDDPRNATMRFNHERLVRCVLCPTAYHTGNYCVPAGSEILTGSQIICPRHYEPPTKGNHHVNASWCFICAMGGSLICCDLCPTSFHAECLRIAPPEGGYICEDCDTGRYPLYGEVVWVKLGAYRWWPAQILFPFEVPDNIDNIAHKLGEFAVKFFGSHDHYWVNRGRVFLYQEGDTGHKSAKRTSVDGLFLKALDEAKEAHSKIKVERSQRELEARPGMKPPSYIRIKCNKPVGNVRVYEADPSSMTPCDCDPNSTNPCGADTDCLNRILMVECTPGVCAAGERCGNQCFVKREYPPLEPFRTESRGWGLRALKNLKKGEFVIEYVGEMIDESEYRRRLECMHKEKDENYYFLTIDNQRMLDAGPKGNVARFMNHCCLPNCETQKWTVNGDTRVGLFSLKDIPSGQELTFNYNLECVGTDKKPCMCGAPNCSGFIGVKVTKPTEDDKKSKLSKQDLQRGLKRKKKRQSAKLAEGECFECGDGGELLLCDNKTCPKGYHLSCAKRKTWPKGIWLCPWHYCDICKRRTGKRCGFCPRSFCLQHAEGNIKMNSSLGMVCLKHDEDNGKSSNISNGIVEDVEICLKGMVKDNIKDISEQDASRTEPNSDSWFSGNDQETSIESNVNENSISLGNTSTALDSTQNSNVSRMKSETKDLKVQKVSLLNNSNTSPKKRGRPRKYPLPELALPVSPELLSPVKTEIIKNEIKTPEFRPQTENVSTLKKKRGRPRKYPLVLSPNSVTFEANTSVTPVPDADKVIVPLIKTENNVNVSKEPLGSSVSHSRIIASPKKKDNEPNKVTEAPLQTLTKQTKVLQTETDNQASLSKEPEIISFCVKPNKNLNAHVKPEEKPDSENSNSPKESFALVTPRTSNRKRHLSEKLTAFLTKSAKKNGLKSFLLVEEIEKSINEPEESQDKKLALKSSESHIVAHKSVSHKINKNTATKPKKGKVSGKVLSKSIDSYMTRLNTPRVTQTGDTNKHKIVVDCVPSISTTPSKLKSSVVKSKSTSGSKLEKSNFTKITSPRESKASKTPKDKFDVSKSSKQNSIKTLYSANGTSRTEESIKSDKPSYPTIFKSFQKKRTILQRVNHKPDLGKSSLDKKLSLTSVINHSLVLKDKFEISEAEKIKQTVSQAVHTDKNGSLYQDSQLNGVDSGRRLLESFDDAESQFLDENVTTIPIKCSEFEQTKDEFQTKISSPEEIDTQQPTNTEFSDLSGEENPQKLSEDGKYQILTNMRPESLDFDKQGSVLMPVGS